MLRCCRGCPASGGSRKEYAPTGRRVRAHIHSKTRFSLSSWPRIFLKQRDRAHLVAGWIGRVYTQVLLTQVLLPTKPPDRNTASSACQKCVRSQIQLMRVLMLRIGSMRVSEVFLLPKHATVGKTITHIPISCKLFPHARPRSLGASAKVTLLNWLLAHYLHAVFISGLPKLPCGAGWGKGGSRTMSLDIRCLAAQPLH